MSGTTWLSSPVTGSVLSIAGLVISVVGFLGTVIGLIATYRQSKDAKSAAEAAAQAASQVRDRVTVFDAAAEAFKATASIHETQRHLRNEAWLSAVESYSSARESLVRLRALTPTLDESHSAEISVMLADISSVCRQIDKAPRGEEPKLNRAKVLDKCRDYEEVLQRVTIEIQKASR